jgi:hypothetical protein
LGVRVDPNNCPAFCYRITVTNTGCVPLNNVSVTDDHLSLTGCGFPSSLPVGGSASCIVSDVGHCSNTTNTVTAQAVGIVVDSQTQTVTSTDTNAVVIVPISVQCTLLISTDNGLTFNTYTAPNCPSVLLGHSYIVRTVVTNTGSYDLGNVIVTSTGTSPLCFGATNMGILPVGGSVNIDCSFTCQTPGENDYAVQVSAQASQASGHVCAYNTNGVLITTTSQCATCVKCIGLPQICVTKAIACFLGTNASGADVCGTYGPSATGVQGDTQEPAFCYSITVSNCGTIPMTNVSVIDSLFGDLTADFACVSPVFPVGGHCTFEFRTEHPVGTYTNVVTARGCSVFDNTICTNASAQAVATVIPASVACQVFYTIDGGPPTNNVTLMDQNPHTIVFYVTITNTGVANLGDIHVTDEQANLGCGAISYVIADLDQGASVTFAVCTNASFICTNNFTAINSTIMTVADQFTYGVNHLPLCSHDLMGTNVTSGTNFGNIIVRSECVTMLACRVANACRVTGGGRQDLNDPNGSVCPTDVRYVTHGGQVGAPVGDKVCSIDTTLPNYWLGNPCIHGRWTHVRHEQGGLEGNFHGRFYDTLDCACLETNYDSNCMYPTAPVVNGVCGNRNIGPLPRKAPANKIVFTGVGDWTCETGRRAPRSCLFRVDIEDRGEPGNAHALGADGKAGRVPDRYRIRIWVLTDAELAQLNSGGGADPYLIHFRDCISACNGINYRDGVCGPNTCSGDDCDGTGTTGTITFPGGCPVRSPNVDDGGEMLHGNHQIHPMIMDCDPANPKGPGLAKP